MSALKFCTRPKIFRATNLVDDDGDVYVFFPKSGIYGQLRYSKWTWWSVRVPQDPQLNRDIYNSSVRAGSYVPLKPPQYPPLTLKEEDFKQ